MDDQPKTPKIIFAGPSKMIGPITYWAPPWWKFWQRKLRRNIIADARYQATELAAGRDPWAHLEWGEPQTRAPWEEE